MNDFELALQLQKSYNDEAEKKRKEEEASLALALKLQNDEQIFSREQSERPEFQSKLLQEKEDRKLAKVYSQTTDDSISTLPLPAWDPSISYLEFSQDNESVQYDKATLCVNFHTKEYSLLYPKHRQTMMQEAPKKVSLISYSETMTSKSISKEELIREITLKGSNFDPVEIRYVAASLKHYNPTDFYNINRLAAKVFIFNNNKYLREILNKRTYLPQKQTKHSKYDKSVGTQVIPVLDLHGLFVVEARQRILPFFALCFSKRLRKCGLCVGVGRTFESRLGDAIIHMLKKLSSESQFSRRAVLSFDRENDGLINVKINLDCINLAK